MKKIILVFLVTMALLSACQQKDIDTNIKLSSETANNVSSNVNLNDKHIDNSPQGSFIPAFDESIGKYGYIDENGNWAIPAMYDEVGADFFHNANQDIFPVMLDEKWGYVDRQNRFVIEPTFITGFYFTKDGIAFVGSEEVVHRYTLDKDGNEIEIGLDEDITVYIPKEDLENGLAAKYSYVVKYIKFGYVDINGDWVITPCFNIPTKLLEITPYTVFDFVGNKALMYDDVSCKYGYIDRTGKWIEQPEYDYEDITGQ